MSDPFTRALLTVIALALVVLALRGTPAQAVDPVICRVEGPIEVRVAGTVETQAKYGAPGSSTSYPLHVRHAD